MPEAENFERDDKVIYKDRYGLNEEGVVLSNIIKVIHGKDCIVITPKYNYSQYIPLSSLRPVEHQQ